MAYTLVVDIGGTNSRAGISEAGKKGGRLRDVREYKCRDFSGPGDIITSYLRDAEIKKAPRKTVIAAAGPVTDRERFVFTNNHDWGIIDFASTGKRLKTYIALINDFNAQAFATAVMLPEDFRTIKPGSLEFLPSSCLGETDEKGHRHSLVLSDPDKRIGVIGPGTGLGIGSAEMIDGRLVVGSSEGGRTHFPAQTDEEFQVAEAIKRSTGEPDIYYRSICSGPGLLRTFEAYRTLAGEDGTTGIRTPEDVVRQALVTPNGPARQALDLFTKALGRIAGTVALTKTTHGGIIISGGGLVSGLADHFNNNALLLDEFSRNGLPDESNFVRDISIRVVRKSNAGLLGAHAFAQYGM